MINDKYGHCVPRSMDIEQLYPMVAAAAAFFVALFIHNMRRLKTE